MFWHFLNILFCSVFPFLHSFLPFFFFLLPSLHHHFFHFLYATFCLLLHFFSSSDWEFFSTAISVFRLKMLVWISKYIKLGMTESFCCPPEAITASLRSYQFSSVSQSCSIICDCMNRSTPGLPVQLPEFTQTHVHWVSDAIQPSLVPFSSCLQSFPASGSFQLSQLFTSGGQGIGVSASISVLPMNIQD